jgi:hypothetical protein
MIPKTPPTKLEYPPVNKQTGTAYTVGQNDNAGVITCSSGSATTVTVPAGLGQGFNCLIIQIGAGTVTIAAGSGVTINNADSFDAISAQYGAATLYAYAPDTFYLGGQLA